jgi:hypothetical protein
MTNTDPLASTHGARGTQDSTHSPQRTLGGALATVLLTVGLFLAMVAPTPVVVGALSAPAVGGLALLVAKHRRTRRLCVPRTDRCVRV